MKKCSICGQDKPLSEYYAHPTTKDGLFKACKECQNTKQKKYYQDNKEERTKYQRQWNKDHKEYHNSRKAFRRSRTKTGNLSAEDKRVVRGLYRLARLYGWITGGPWQVDHILPLKGKTVSGLHVPSNLQVVPASYNSKKGNRLLEST